MLMLYLSLFINDSMNRLKKNISLNLQVPIQPTANTVDDRDKIQKRSKHTAVLGLGQKAAN